MLLSFAIRENKKEYDRKHNGPIGMAQPEGHNLVNANNEKNDREGK